MKIGIITHNFPNNEKDRRNAGIFVYDFAQALSKKAKVVVFSPGEVDQARKIGGIRTYFFKFEEKLGDLKIYYPHHIIKFTSFFMKGKKVLDKFFSENQDLDFVLSMWAFPGGDFANYLYQKYKVPYAVYCLGSDIYIYAKKPILKNLIIKYLKEAKIVLADSPDLAKETKKLSGIETLFLPSSSNFSQVKNSAKVNKNMTTLTFIGRLEYIKGIDLLVDAFIKQKSENLQVNIIGFGSLEKIFKEKAKNYGNIKFWGNINDKAKISDILSQSQWLVIPSRSDSIPLVFSEAMKLSLPVIVSDLPDLKYLVKKYKVGLIFKNNSATDLLRVLDKVTDQRMDRKEFKSNTKKAAGIFDLEKTSAKLISLLENKL